ncbi:MAG: hypothetical protein K2O74_06010 [Eubacteriales bacterium]|nr:hypothetical protein [Eubacteriales bacterium]
MRRFQTEYTPDECTRLLREALRGEGFWRKPEPVRGIVIGRRFRLRLTEYPRYHEDDSRVGCVLYGRILRCGKGSEIRILELSRAHDPLLWAVMFSFAMLFFVQIHDGTLISWICFLLLYASAYWFAMMNYDVRGEKYRALVVDLRYFLRTTLNAKETGWGE